jgi:hypothetical protein
MEDVTTVRFELQAGRCRDGSAVPRKRASGRRRRHSGRSRGGGTLGPAASRRHRPPGRHLRLSARRASAFAVANHPAQRTRRARHRDGLRRACRPVQSHGRGRPAGSAARPGTRRARGHPPPRQSRREHRRVDHDHRLCGPDAGADGECGHRAAASRGARNRDHEPRLGGRRRPAADRLHPPAAAHPRRSQRPHRRHHAGAHPCGPRRRRPGRRSPAARQIRRGGAAGGGRRGAPRRHHHP